MQSDNQFSDNGPAIYTWQCCQVLVSKFNGRKGGPLHRMELVSHRTIHADELDIPEHDGPPMLV